MNPSWNLIMFVKKQDEKEELEKEERRRRPSDLSNLVMYDPRGPSLVETSLESSHDSTQIAQSSRIINEHYVPGRAWLRTKKDPTNLKVSKYVAVLWWKIDILNVGKKGVCGIGIEYINFFKESRAK